MIHASRHSTYRHTPSSQHSRPRQSRSFTEKKRMRKIGLIFCVIIALVIIVALVSWLSGLSFWQISSVRVTGGVSVDMPKIQSIVMGSLQGKYADLFSKANAFIFPRSDTVSLIKKEFDNISDVALNVSGLNTLDVHVEEKVPVAIVCMNLPDFESGDLGLHESECFFADADGYAFYGDVRSVALDYDKYFLPSLAASNTRMVDPALLGRLSDLSRQINGLGIPVRGIFIGENGEYEVYAQNTDSSILLLYFPAKDDLKEEIINLSAFWKSMVGKRSLSGKGPTFEYINLRVSPNVFYNISNAESGNTTGSAEKNR